jgi:hypothetical protein
LVAGYNRKFVHSYGLIAVLLTTLLKRDAFRWTAATTKAFEALKTTLTTTPVL